MLLIARHPTQGLFGPHRRPTQSESGLKRFPGVLNAHYSVYNVAEKSGHGSIEG
jgi:hypothetical protein